MDHLQLPEASHYSVRNVVVPIFRSDGEVAFDLTRLNVSDGRITDQPSTAEIDGNGGMILPAFVDMHTHLDKGHIWPRSKNADGTFGSALTAVRDDCAKNWTENDVRRRMEFSLKCAYAHGTRAIRTHLDSAAPQHRISWPVFDELRSDWFGRIELQAVTILSIENVDGGKEFADVADVAASYGGALGCVTYPCVDLRERLQLFFRMASERGMPVDLHVDETRETDSNSLRTIAEVVLELGFDGNVTAGHCCSLSRQDPSAADDTIKLVAEAGIGVVCLPMCNMYLQDRQAGRTPRWRGIAPVHELWEQSVPVCFASDNTRDPFYPYGDLDMLEVMREATRICQLDHSGTSWFNAFSTRPGELCGFSRNRLECGDVADFIYCSAREWTELLARPQADRVVVRSGRAIDRRLPQYRELDDLMEAT